MPRIRVPTRSYANLGDGLWAFEPGVIYELTPAEAAHPWIAQHAEIVPDSPDDLVFDYMFNRMCTRREIEERRERDTTHAAEVAEEKKRRKIEEAEAKERLEPEKLEKAAKITAKANAEELANILRSPAVEVEQSKRGRPKGSGSLAEDDARLFPKMNRLLSSRKAKSPSAAARLVAHEAKGDGTIESKALRLARRYRRSNFGNEEAKIAAPQERVIVLSLALYDATQERKMRRI